MGLIFQISGMVLKSSPLIADFMEIFIKVFVGYGDNGDTNGYISWGPSSFHRFSF